MSAENVRAVLFRTLTDSDFHNLMLINPDEALKGYDLTNDERRILTAPDKNLYKILGGAQPSTLLAGFLIFFEATRPSLALEDEKIAQLVNSIQNAVGQERLTKIMQLVQNMQEPNQAKGDVPQNE
jgi:hypothetical protein